METSYTQQMATTQIPPPLVHVWDLYHVSGAYILLYNSLIEILSANIVCFRVFLLSDVV